MVALTAAAILTILMNIAIDFNGVLCDRQNAPEGYKLGPPIKGAKEALELLSLTYKLYIFTDMADTTKGYNAVADWMKFFNIPWDYITNTKPRNLKFFIDDKAIRFIDWKSAMLEVDGRTKES